jgi:hypothetical protein
MVNKIEGLLSTFYKYFCKSFKRYLDFTKLTKVMEMKGANSKKMLKHDGLVLLSLVKHVMAEYMTLLMKITINNLSNEKAKKTLSLKL